MEEINPGFTGLIKFISRKNEKAIERTMQDHFKRLPQGTKNFIQQVFNQYKLWGEFDIKKNKYDVFCNRAQILRQQRDYLVQLHSRLADARSKNVLYAILANWLYWDTTMLPTVRETAYPEYFDPNILPQRKDEVYVDLGAFNGDSALNFLSAYKEYKRVYCYEIAPGNFQAMQTNLANFSNIELRQKGVGAEPGTMFLSENADPMGNMLVSDGAGQTVEVVRIDDDIPEPVSFIKMDIEGGEQNALRGCIRQIRENHPHLAISAYHGDAALCEIPQMIDEIQPGYQFYLRSHGIHSSIPVDFVLLAVWKEAIQ